jgi:hypothetical protein
MAKHMTGGKGVSSANKLARCLQGRACHTLPSLVVYPSRTDPCEHAWIHALPLLDTLQSLLVLWPSYMTAGHLKMTIACSMADKSRCV